jgi:hypothetical protein
VIVDLHAAIGRVVTHAVFVRQIVDDRAVGTLRTLLPTLRNVPGLPLWLHCAMDCPIHE